MYHKFQLFTDYPKRFFGLIFFLHIVKNLYLLLFFYLHTLHHLSTILNFLLNLRNYPNMKHTKVEEEKTYEYYQQLVLKKLV
jgi:hypothetical protein